MAPCSKPLLNIGSERRGGEVFTELYDLQTVVPFRVSRITSLPQIERTTEPERNEQLWQHGDATSWGPFLSGQGGWQEKGTQPGKAWCWLPRNVLGLCFPLFLLSCSPSSLPPSLPPSLEMNKELSFLSAAAKFNQWINVSTFVGMCIILEMWDAYSGTLKMQLVGGGRAIV